MRLKQGKKDDKTEYSDNPIEQARSFENDGASIIHVVDLDGAFDGEGSNKSIIKNIAGTVKCSIETGGGIRTVAKAKELFDAGVSRVVIGTVAVEKPEIVEEMIKIFGASRVVLGVDARDGFVAIHGWEKTSKIKAVDLIKAFVEKGLERVLYTDISRDGMLTGPNFAAMREILEQVKVKLIASGGISSLDDIKKLRELESFGVDSYITGKAIYEKRFSLKEAIKVAGG